VRTATLAVTRRTASWWELAPGDDDGRLRVTLEVGENGIPVSGPDDEEWSLEL
jgi:hypothetical protein